MKKAIITITLAAALAASIAYTAWLDRDTGRYIADLNERIETLEFYQDFAGATVDRIEEGIIAVIEMPDGTMVNFPAAALPDGMGEGSRI